MSSHYWQQVKERIDWPVLSISGGLLTAFVLVALINVDAVAQFVSSGFNFSVNYFDVYWQLLLLATFFVGVFLAVSKYGKVKLGKKNTPEMSMFKWTSIIIVSGLGAGGVFWAAAEPMYYFMEVPPMHSGIEAKTADAIAPALAQSYMSWGFTAWALYGAVSALIIMYAHYNKGMSLKPRTMLYPIFGDKLETSKWGSVIDAFCIIAAAAGTIGPIGFLGLQVSYGLNALYGIPDVFATQMIVIGALIAIVIISAVTGIHKGIQRLSRLNVWTAIIVAGFLVVFGAGGFIINSFVSSYGTYLTEFMNIHTHRQDQEWLGFWMLFFFGWFIGFGPLVAILVARISRGRTIRQVFVAVSILTAVTSNFWFTVVGGSGIHYEMENPGSVSGPLNEAGLPAAMIAVTQQMPLAWLMPTVFLIMTILFVVTTADSMSYSMSMGVTGEENPPKSVRVFWALIMGIIAVILINIGEGGIDALQSFVVIAAIPVSIIMLPVLWLAPRVAKQMAVEQGIEGLEEKKQSEQADPDPGITK
ncbi:BCCT family transporter [Salibacterium qingdaonense]|uniref:Choline-glycine betaine transporter n=1 Tax=Salibacterium qingdaonense TaxID=266892 RepID=A0A1I4PNI6_9BACI|nr:BCCT family transporter [Salibacterium qingdaonense]SFM29392.1 Choline-glycine betaine transporter [Salibacterium qingdaonense]